MPRVGLSTAGVVDAALATVDEEGADALTLAAVAARTGVATPSLYKHVGGLPELRRLVAVRVMQEATDRIGAAIMGRAGGDAVAALMAAMRAYAVAHPSRYALIPLQPLGDPALAPTGRRLLEAILAVLRGYGLVDSEAVHAARRLRATLHGFVSLEAAGGFGLPEDLDTSFEQLVAMVTASLQPAAGPT